MNGFNTNLLLKLGGPALVAIATYFFIPLIAQGSSALVAEAMTKLASFGIFAAASTSSAEIASIDYFKLAAVAAFAGLVMWTTYRSNLLRRVFGYVFGGLAPFAGLFLKGIRVLGGPVLMGISWYGMYAMYKGLFVTTIFPAIDKALQDLPARLAAVPTGYAVWVILAFKIVLVGWLASKVYNFLARKFGYQKPTFDKDAGIFVAIGRYLRSLSIMGLVGFVGSLIVAFCLVVLLLKGLVLVAAILPAVLPGIHMAVEVVLFAVPAVLYYKAVTRPVGSKDYLKWFCRIARPHWFGEKKFTTWGYFLVILAFIYLVAQLNSGLQDAMIALKNALVAKDQAKYDVSFWYAINVFIFATFFMPFNIWIRAKAYMHWRMDLTKYVLRKYLAIDRKYYSINGHEEIDNPDERIHEDVGEFTSRTYSLVLTMADVVTTLWLFTTKLWVVSSVLGFAAIAYSLAGTVAMLFFANKMVGFMVNEKRTEANFRYYLIFVRILAESIAFFRGEKKELAEVERRFDRILDNYNKLIAWTRNQNFVLKFYGYMDYFVVLIIVAPLYFSGKIQYGEIDGAQMAFSMVLGSLSIFVSEFVTLSKLAATTERLGKFMDAIDEPDTRPGEPAFSVVEDAEATSIELENISIVTPRHPRLLIKDLSLTIAQGKSVIFVGPSGSGKTSAFRVISGLWKKGSGTIKRPPLSDFMFLPQKPYMSVGTLRDQILYPNIEKMRLDDGEMTRVMAERRARVSDEEIIAILAEVGLVKFVERYPAGLDTVQEHQSWGDVLSPGEQLRVSFSRVLISKPKIVFMDEATAALDTKNEKKLYVKLKQLGVTFASVGHRPSLVHFHDQVVELMGDESGGWRLRTPADYAAEQQAEADKD